LLRDAVALEPTSADSHFKLGAVLDRLGDRERAVEEYRRALAINPNHATAHNNLGNSLHAMGDSEAAKEHLAAAVRCDPSYAHAYHNLGYLLASENRLEDAAEAYSRAMSLDPTLSEAMNNLGVVRQKQRRFSDAAACHLLAVAARPDHAEAYSNLGSAYQAQGLLHEAIAAYRKAIALRPQDAATHSNLLFALNYHPNWSAEAIFEEHQVWGKRHAQGRAAVNRVSNPTAKSKLRIGYVSADFREHSVGFFFEPILKHHDRWAAEIFCYSNNARDDATTQRMRALADGWCSIATLSDDQAAQRIAADCIDVLVDLSGHTARNRLPVFARKPAPVQATYLGYPNTTGMRQMDYRISDQVCDPQQKTGLFTESVHRLPRCAWCFSAPADAPDVRPAPLERTGFITFGCFNNLAKLNAPLLDLWAEILKSVERSRLVLKSLGLEEEATRARLREMFRARSIADDRIELLKPTESYQDHLAAYEQIDIALDTFPYHGTTTTCEALFMGGPVVSMRGSTPASWVSASLLEAVGVSELLSHTPEEFVRTARELAADGPRVTTLREELRDRMRASPLMDGPGLARALEQAVRERWERHVAR